MDHNNLPYHVVRSKRRKTAQISVKAEKIEVRIPEWVSDQWVEKWVSERAGWIQRKWNDVNLSSQEYRIEIQPGTLIPYLGKNHRLSWQEGKRSGVCIVEERILVTVSNRSTKPEEERVKSALEGWFKKQAETVLKERLEYWQSEMSLNYTSFKTKGYRRRWGSCSSRGEISFNWKLIFASLELVDYVVVHEIAHLQHLNHSKDFWSLVGRYCPQWKNYRKELNTRAAWLEW